MTSRRKALTEKTPNVPKLDPIKVTLHLYSLNCLQICLLSQRERHPDPKRQTSSTSTIQKLLRVGTQDPFKVPTATYHNPSLPVLWT